jgi:hypothetical protein
MKKFLFLMALSLTLGSHIKLQAQSCNNTTPLIKYTNGTHTGVAPFTIDGSIADWETNLLGTGTGDAVTPFNPPAASAANWSKDGHHNDPGADDLDGPQTVRDLRFFSFTYDDYNVYFYFRRINSGTAQISFAYMMDINADGYMNTGEPVIIITTTSGGTAISSFTINPYVVNVGVDYVAGKGNYMTKPTAPNAGLADGYNLAGNYGAAVDLTAVGALGPNEKFLASMTEIGFGTEFAIPWKYFRNWTNPLTSTPLAPGDVFTYHVSTLSGNADLSKAVDNAGGCCAGLAVIGSPNFVTESISSSVLVNNLQYRVRMKMKNNTNAPVKVSLDNVAFSAITQYLSRPIDETDFLVQGYIDANGNGVIDGTDASTLKTFTYGAGTFVSQPIIYSSPTPRDSLALAASGGTGWFIIDVRFPVNQSVKSLDANFGTNGVIDLPVGPCQAPGLPQQGLTPLPILTALPVTFGSFTATRNHSTVVVKWETVTEINNSGFAIERNINGTWEQVGYVTSQATNGNSIAPLYYQFNDLNNTKGITQYRVKQIDIDAKGKYTDIRAVRGEDQSGSVIIYPNPTNDGKVNIVFEDANVTRDIAVSDMSGRTVKQMRGVTNNNITIENLNPGMYTVRIVAPATGDQIVQKIVVNKR